MPQTKREHTKTPWHYQENADAYTHIIRGENDVYILGLSQKYGGTDEANARHIVHCVNMHDELVEALRIVSEGFNTLFDNRNDWTPVELDKHMSDLQQVASDALATAQKEG